MKGPTSRLLRTLGGVELWHVEDSRGSKKRPIIRYMVRSASGEKNFERPHEGWRHFQQLTNAPDRDVRPDPPPIEEAQLRKAATPRKPRRRRRPAGSKSSA
jgi:hypothetical protein